MLDPVRARCRPAPMPGSRAHEDIDSRGCGHFRETIRLCPGGGKGPLKQAADDMKQYYDWNCQAVPEYKVGDRVWLSLQNYSSDCPMKKLDHKWAGPFLITKVISPAAIKLRLSTREKHVHPIVSVSSIRPYTPDAIVERPQPPQPGPITVDGKEEYEVKEILDSMFRWGKLWYLVNFVECSH